MTFTFSVLTNLNSGSAKVVLTITVKNATYRSQMEHQYVVISATSGIT